MGNFLTNTLKRHIPELRGQEITPTSIISGVVSGGADAFGYVFDPSRNPLMQYPYELFQRGMTESQNVFSSSRETLDKFQTGFGQELSTMGESLDIGWRYEEGILGLGNPSFPIPSVNGATSPNLEQFNLGDGKDPFTAMLQRNKLGKPGGSTKEFTDWVRTLSQKTGHHLTGSTYPGRGGSGGSSGGDDSTDEPEETVKGPGTLRGREATLQLNVGAKGLGRKSLKIGTKGMGKSKVGKYRTHLSGRTSRGYG